MQKILSNCPIQLIKCYREAEFQYCSWLICQAFRHKTMDEKRQFLSLNASYLPIQVLKTSLFLGHFLTALLDDQFLKVWLKKKFTDFQFSQSDPVFDLNCLSSLSNCSLLNLLSLSNMAIRLLTYLRKLFNFENWISLRRFQKSEF